MWRLYVKGGWNWVVDFIREATKADDGQGRRRREQTSHIWNTPLSNMNPFHFWGIVVTLYWPSLSSSTRAGRVCLGNGVPISFLDNTKKLNLRTHTTDTSTTTTNLNPSPHGTGTTPSLNLLYIKIRINHQQHPPISMRLVRNDVKTNGGNTPTRFSLYAISAGGFTQVCTSIPISSNL
jgi:hypothetical protein